MQTVINRNELKKDWAHLIAFIQKNHVMGPEIEKELFIERTPVRGLCHQRGYFILFGEFFCQYVMDHIITDVSAREIGRSVQQVIFYDTYVEYEAERMKRLSSVKPNEQTGLNLN